MTILTMKDTVSLYVYYYHIVGYVLHNIKELVIGSSVILETCYYSPLTTTTSYLSNYLVLLSTSSSSVLIGRVFIIPDITLLLLRYRIT
jgi:hypothetical protein